MKARIVARSMSEDGRLSGRLSLWERVSAFAIIYDLIAINLPHGKVLNYLVGPREFESLTFAMSMQRSNQLSYEPVIVRRLQYLDFGPQY